MPIEYTRRIPREQYGYEEFKAVLGDDQAIEELAAAILSIDTIIAERPTPMQVFTGRPDNGTVDGYEYEDAENIPFDDVPHPADSSAEFNKLKQRRRQAPQAVMCGICGSETYDNMTDRQPGARSPAYKCKKGDNLNDHVQWIQKDGLIGEWTVSPKRK